MKGKLLVLTTGKMQKRQFPDLLLIQQRQMRRKWEGTDTLLGKHKWMKS